MIDLKDLRENPDKYRKGASDKHSPADIDALIEIDERVRDLQTELQSLHANRNHLNKQIGPLVGKLKKTSEDEKQEIEGKITTLKKESEEFKSAESLLSDDLRDLEAQRLELWLKVPQPADPDVPVGKSSDDNVQL
ncbi:MAG: hypothetical protein AB8C95_05865, partial [Phycisphaeraceae bacterium]